MTDPFQARQIAERGVYMLGQMRTAATIEALNEIYGDWKSYAIKNGVCHQIRDHFSGAYAEVASKLKSKSRASVRQPAGDAE